MAQAQLSAAQVTAQQKANWTNHTPIYADIIINKDKLDWASQQATAAVTRHSKFAAGKF